MLYKLDIKDESLNVFGLYGTYEIIDNGKDGFVVSVIQDSCVNEIDSDGEEYLVDSGQEWSIPTKNLTGLNTFIKKCEEERLWNFINGPVFRVKIDSESSILFIKGNSRNFVIGEDSKGLYLDDALNTNSHNYVENLNELTKKIIQEDDWWIRNADEIMDIVRNSKSQLMVTSGGNLKLIIQNKIFVLGQKDNGQYWINVSEDQERHIYYKDSLKDIIKLFS